jgi:general secretion pathway protein G
VSFSIFSTKSSEKREGENERGFTLIEILVVVVIIGLLIGLVAINLIPQAEKARRTTAYAQMKSIEEALDLFRLENGRYPTTEEGLEILVSPPGGKEPYLKGGKLPKDPWGNPYVYIRPGPGGKPYDIISYGADGQPGGTEENRDLSIWDEIRGEKEGK